MGSFAKVSLFLVTSFSLLGFAESAARAACSALQAGYRVVTLDSNLPNGQAVKIPAAMWYPTTAPAKATNYTGTFSAQQGTLAVNADIARCDSFPVVVFSHGDLGCGTQSIFVTEELARRGYIVIAPDHWDSMCSSSGLGGRSMHPPYFPSGDPVENPSLIAPWKWTQDAHLDRRNDVEAALEYVLANPFGGTQQADAARVAMMGHSLGGYTSAAMLGGWNSWKDPRFKAALLLSPYLNPISQNLSELGLPVMFQTGTLDLGIAPFLMMPGGSYSGTNGGGESPVLANTYLVNFAGPNHFTWTNAVCAAYGNTQDCIAHSPEAAEIVDASVLFLDAHLKGIQEPRLTQQNMGVSGNGVADYWWKTGYTPANAAPSTIVFPR